MTKNAERLLAKLRWEAACERLAFALDAQAGVSPNDAPDLESALRLAQDALEEVREAFLSDRGGKPMN